MEEQRTLKNKFGPFVDLDLILNGLVKTVSSQPITPCDLEDLRRAHGLKDARVDVLRAVQSAQQLVEKAVRSQPVALQALSMAHFPTLVVLGEPAEIGGVTQYHQLVNGQIRQTKKNKNGWPAHTSFLFLRGYASGTPHKTHSPISSLVARLKEKYNLVKTLVSKRF